MAGTIETVGDGVRSWSAGDRVIVPFSIGCGECRSCQDGHLNTCDRAFTPGFSAWGSFAELVAVEHAEVNLVKAPDGLDPAHAAALGCRFITAFRAIVDRGRLHTGETLAVYGCGGVGLSAVMIGAALGARVVAVDVNRAALGRAVELGATATVDAATDDPAAAVRDLTEGGAHVSLDAVGRTDVVINSVRSLRKHGRHIQAGLMFGEDAAPPIPMEPVIMGELEILGVRGMPATDYPRVFDLVSSGAVDPGRLVTDTVSLDGASAVLERMERWEDVGVTVIDRF